MISGFGPQAAELAGRIGDGLITTSPDEEVIEAYRRAGGDGPRYGQVTVCYGEDEAAARKLLRLMDALEENDDVQDVYANFDIPEGILEAVA